MHRVVLDHVAGGAVGHGDALSIFSLTSMPGYAGFIEFVCRSVERCVVSRASCVEACRSSGHTGSACDRIGTCCDTRRRNQTPVACG